MKTTLSTLCMSEFLDLDLAAKPKGEQEHVGKAGNVWRRSSVVLQDPPDMVKPVLVEP